MEQQPLSPTGDNIIVIKFSDSKIPVFKEKRNRDYIEYGEDNLYPDYLTYLFNKSAKHNAIISGKAFYVFGKGFENGDFKVNRLGETLNDVAKKLILDIELYGGCRMEVIWNRMGKVGEIYHADYTTLRLSKEGDGFYFKESWQNKYDREEPEFIPAFNHNNPVGSQIYAYNEYRPGQRFYPLPGYIGSNNYIETDIEISKYYLSSIRNGMMPSKMLQFFTGDPGEEKKKEIEKGFQKRFAGSENAGRFLIVYNDKNATKSVEVSDLSSTDLDKLFVELNKTCQQEIFSGHLVTSPMLFGIKTEGQLGGSTELNISYSIFQNTYSIPKAQAFSKELSYVLGYSENAIEYELQPTDPVGLQFDVKDVLDRIPDEFILEKLGVPKELWDVQAKPSESPDVMSNEAVRSLSGRQHQQLLRIIRQYNQGKLTEPAARTLLRTGLGLADEDISHVLGIKSQFSETDVIEIFDQFGDSKNDYEVLKSKKVSFSEADAQEDEAVFAEAFKTNDITRSEMAIIELIKKDSKITPLVISQAIKETEAYVNAKIKSLTKKGYIESSILHIGQDEIIERTIPSGVDISAPPIQKAPAQIMVKYSYEPKPGLQPIIATTRPFCRKLIQLNRFYSRAEIEKISLRLGYSVFDRKGGWWGKNPECRHRWVSNIVVKKTGEK